MSRSGIVMGRVVPKTHYFQILCPIIPRDPILMVYYIICYLIKSKLCNGG